MEGGPLGMSCPLFPSSLYVPPISYNDQFPPVGSAQDIVAVTLHYLQYHPSPSDAMDASSPGRAVYSVTAEYGPAALGATPGYYWLFTIKHC